ncbi:MAG: hypothetical protein MUO40_07780, partial [Anaerolineaceae bacterium]|nr:hypothetical protein [Anaerolineaceae bacterium]
MNITIVISWVVGVVWALTIGLFIYMMISSVRNAPVKKGKPVLIGLVITAIILTVINSGLVFVQPQER